MLSDSVVIIILKQKPFKLSEKYKKNVNNFIEETGINCLKTNKETLGTVRLDSFYSNV